ncbi:MAG TPA: hypothetical protein VK618_08480, partial [Flavitalea sp.]|nr:hypothetical protein [Flavitalea sp.]
MALPHLIKYVYTNGTDEVIRRGKKIHAIGYVELVDFDELLDAVSFRVKDDSYSTYYRVNIQKFKDPKTLSVRCTCPYNLGDICRHEAASLIQLQEMLDKNILKADKIDYDQQHTVVKMKFIDLKTLRLLCSPETYAAADNYVRNNKAEIITAKDEMVKATVKLEEGEYKVVIRKNEERNFDTSCDYEDTKYPLCLPKVILFLQLLNTGGPYYFDTIRNWDKEKNKLLELYGYSITDDLKGKFEFTYKDGKPFLRLLDPTIKRVTPQELSRTRTPVPVSEPQLTDINEIVPDKLEASAQRLGIVFNFNSNAYPNFLVESVSGEPSDEQDAYVSKVVKLDLAKYINGDLFPESDRQLLPSIRKLQEGEIGKYLNRNSPFSGIWENIIHHEDDDLPEETKSLIVEYIHPKLKKLLGELSENPFVFILPAKKPFKTDNLESVGIVTHHIDPYFRVNKVGDEYVMECWVRLSGQPVPVTANEVESSLIFVQNHNLYLWHKPEDVNLVDRFMSKGKLVFNQDDWPEELRKFILPLTKDYHVDFDPSLVTQVKDGEPEKRVVLQEKGDYLV